MANTNEIIAVGRTAEILSYGKDQILKLFRPGIPEHLSSDEFNISSAVFNLGLSCPRPIEIIDYEGRKGIIYSQVVGVTMLKTLEKRFGQPLNTVEKWQHFIVIFTQDQYQTCQNNGIF